MAAAAAAGLNRAVSAAAAGAGGMSVLDSEAAPFLLSVCVCGLLAAEEGWVDIRDDLCGESWVMPSLLPRLFGSMQPPRRLGLLSWGGATIFSRCLFSIHFGLHSLPLVHYRCCKNRTLGSAAPVLLYAIAIYDAIEITCDPILFLQSCCSYSDFIGFCTV